MVSVTDFKLSKLAVPGVCLLICFLAYTSQVLLLWLDPAPLTKSELWKFNATVSCIWICYYKACTTNPGTVERTSSHDLNLSGKSRKKESETRETALARNRWCRKCESAKPPRAHHCKTCGRCIPKMDHHCPWTSNCVSHFTFPHFVRFLAFSVLSMSFLEYFLYVRCALLWEKRSMPSYLGPSVFQLVYLLLLVCMNSLTLFMLLVMFVRTLWGLGGNVTTIESWEIARHERLLRRSKVFGGYLYGPDGIKIRIEKQEFPYDIGIWSNIVQGMGTANPLLWLWPFARTPTTSGVHFGVNGFDEKSSEWPPPDPDRIPRLSRNVDQGEGFLFGPSKTDGIAEFKERQARDFERQKLAHSSVSRRKPFSERYASAETHIQGSSYQACDDESPHDSGEEGWASPDGDRLRDFGVDEDAEFYDQEDVPLGQLIRQREMATLKNQ